MNQILASIDKVRYLHSIVVALGGTTEESQFQQAKEYFGRLSNSKRFVRVVVGHGPNPADLSGNRDPGNRHRRKRKGVVCLDHNWVVSSHGKIVM